MRSWLKWAVPTTALVLAAAIGGGLAAREQYGTSIQGITPASPESVAPEPVPGGLAFTADAAAHPDQGIVRALLEVHFDAINGRDYDGWKSTVVPAKWREQPRDEWLQAYRTTHDSDVVVHRIERTPDGTLRVLLTFTSTQDPAQAPPQLAEPCIRWRVVYPLVPDEGGLRLDINRFPGSALLDPCRPE
ncbi:hypothetical protein [Saccharopolyspora sp. CA-218241]|uniref:hypothetical protein n=1 Tax=Saccharopolyspora sp. CA-218241 TaxID=3240027 RepID=UPI003D9615BE